MKYTERFERAVAKTGIDLEHWRKLVEEGVEGTPAHRRYCDGAWHTDT